MSALRSALSSARNPLVAGAAVAAIVGASLCIGAAPSFANGGGDGGDGGDKITICHAHASDSNPYNVEKVSANSIVTGGGGHGQSGINTGDIIPPFDYGDGQHYAGQNWDAAGQAIFNNGCVPVTAPTSSTSATQTEQPADPTTTSPSEADPTTTSPSEADPTTTSPSEADPTTTSTSATETEQPADPATSSSSDTAADDTLQVTICHAHASDSNPYNVEKVSANSIVTGDGGHGQSGINTGDIIPPFDYGDGQHYAGQNWDAAGQAIFNNGCVPVTAPTSSTSTSTQPPAPQLESHLTITKHVSPSIFTAPGQTVTYTYTVSNVNTTGAGGSCDAATGVTIYDIAVEEPFTAAADDPTSPYLADAEWDTNTDASVPFVHDSTKSFYFTGTGADKPTPALGTAAESIAEQAALAPCQSVSFTAPYVVSSADFATGSVTNVAYAWGYDGPVEQGTSSPVRVRTDLSPAEVLTLDNFATSTSRSEQPSTPVDTTTGVDAISTGRDKPSTTTSQDLAVDAISTTTDAPAAAAVAAAHPLAYTGNSRLPQLVLGGGLVLAAGAVLLAAARLRPGRRSH